MSNVFFFFFQFGLLLKCSGLQMEEMSYFQVQDIFFFFLIHEKNLSSGLKMRRQYEAQLERDRLCHLLFSEFGKLYRLIEKQRFWPRPCRRQAKNLGKPWQKNCTVLFDRSGPAPPCRLLFVQSSSYRLIKYRYREKGPGCTSEKCHFTGIKRQYCSALSRK